MYSFQPNCSLPSVGKAFVSSPDIRGTLDIVWSCVVIILLCTWNIQHPGIPFQLKSHTFLEKLRRDFIRARKQLFWMSVTIICPEYVMGKAYSDFISAWANNKKMQRWAEEDGVEWSLGHSFFADMGGFPIRFPPRDVASARLAPMEDSHDSSSKKAKIQTSIKDPLACDMTQASYFTRAIHRPTHESRYRKKETLVEIKSLIRYYASTKRESLSRFAERNLKARFSSGTPQWQVHAENAAVTTDLAKAEFDMSKLKGRSPRQWYLNILPFQGNIWVLDANQLLVARSVGILDKLPSMTEEELEDRNRSDAAVRIISLLQVGWLIVQLIVRAAKELPSTQLEVVTLSFAACTIISSAFLFRKPQGPQTPCYVTPARYPTPGEMIELALNGPLIFGIRRSYSIQNDSIHKQSLEKSPLVEFVGGSIFGSILFGALHLVAWQFVFPTGVERLLWRIATVTTTVLPLAVFAFTPLVVFVSSLLSSEKLQSMTPKLFGFVSILSYTLCRLFIMAEACRSLYFLPPKAYVTTWAANVPHVG